MARTAGGGEGMSTVLAEQNVYAMQFSEMADRLPGAGLMWVDRLRKNAIQRFLDLGFPTTKLENWKYTNVAPIRRLTLSPGPLLPTASIPQSLRAQIELFPSPRLVFLNGMFNPDLSTAGGAGGAGRTPPLRLLTLSEALGDPKQATALEPHLGTYAAVSDHAFAAWNTASFTDGAWVIIPPGTTVERPINLVFVSEGANAPWVSQPRNLVIVGEGAQVAFVEAFLGVNGRVYLTNAVTEIGAGAGAVIDYYKVERESADSFHVATVAARLAQDAILTSHSISFGAALLRNDLNVALDGEGANCTLNGLFAVDGRRLADNHTLIDHRRPHAMSRELYKGVLAGNAEGVFNGTIIVRKDAQKIDAVQHSRNLLLSDHAQINTKPQLEIQADDVRCSHGATIGQIDEEALFYLKSRGGDEQQAQQILIRAFAAEILDRMRLSHIGEQADPHLAGSSDSVFAAS